MFEISADDLPRFMVCNASKDMAASVPKTETDISSARDEGIAAHYMAATVFRGEKQLDELIDRKAPNGVYMTAEMSEHVNSFLTKRTKGQSYLLQVDYHTHYSFEPFWVVTGQCDMLEYDEHCDVHITDFRYGWRIVEPEQNWTLVSHALAFLKQYREKIHPHAIFHLSIFQPRPYHPAGTFRTWNISMATLQLLEGELIQALTTPSRQLVTSDHCANCKALAICPAARKAEMNAIDASDMKYEDTIDNDQLSFILDNLHRAETHIKDRLKAFEELARHRIKSGKVVNNYSVEFGLGNSRWKEGIDGDILKALTGKDLRKPSLVTPAEAKRRGVDETTVTMLTERPQTGIRLVRVKANVKAEYLFGKDR